MGKIGLHIALFLLLPMPVWAQSDFDLTQRWLNQAVYNPAAAGSDFTSGIYLHARQQWAGMAGAPITGVFSADAYIDRLSSGIGVSFAGDRIGITNTYNARLSYAFYLHFGEKSALSLGLSAGVLSRKVNANGALVDNLSDPLLYYGNESDYSPDFDFGFEYHGPIKLGATVRHVSWQNDGVVSDNSTNIWAYATARINGIGRVCIEPVVSYTHRDGITRMEAGAIAYMLRSPSRRESNDWAWVGAMYRFNGQLALMAGIHITKPLSVGYSFDYGIGQSSRISAYGTHEVFLSWKFSRLFYKDIPCEAFGTKANLSRRITHF